LLLAVSGITTQQLSIRFNHKIIKRKNGGGGGGGSGRKRTDSDSESETRYPGRHGVRARNWAELRRDQPRPDPHFYPHSYRGANNLTRGRGNFSGRSGGGGDDRNFQYGGGGGGGGRPYNRGWAACGKRHH
jgi:hypothetical protein